MILGEFFQQTLWGNTMAQWFFALLIIAGTYLASRIVYFLFQKVFGAFSKKTKSNLDDILVHSLRGPVVFLIFIIALNFSLNILTFPQGVTPFIKKGIWTLVIINISWFVTRLLLGILEHYVAPVAKKKGSDRSKTAFPMLKKIIIIIIWILTIGILLAHFGVDPTGLVAGLGIGGLAFALAAQDVLGNIFGGAAVVSSKPFVVGDRIKVEGYDGFVKELSMRTTTMETFDGTHVVIPNSKIANASLENISREKKRRVRQVLGLEYSTSSAKLEKAKKILADIVKKNPSTADNSLVHFVGFNDSTLDVQVIYWIADLDMILQAKDEINTEIKKRFEKANIGFAYPSQTIYVKK
ncbi:MAG: mechanosensitive ion channel family protein [Candidatus Nanoarchaeia archaeon]